MGVQKEPTLDCQTFGIKAVKKMNSLGIMIDVTLWEKNNR